jgi:2-polyprenyl-3-methyl-5-hydroxy-6-metoxy-1,4-benzoquinol methylase
VQCECTIVKISYGSSRSKALLGKQRLGLDLAARQGFDVYRDAVKLPAFLELLPDIAGKKELDVGCGEGHNTRCFAERGAQMSAIDIAPTFVLYAAKQKGPSRSTSGMP